jgi:hypothetical protein
VLDGPSSCSWSPRVAAAAAATAGSPRLGGVLARGGGAWPADTAGADEALVGVLERNAGRWTDSNHLVSERVSTVEQG